MRTIFYSVADIETHKKMTCGYIDKEKAEVKLEELKKENPNGNFKIVYKWASI